MESSSDRRPIGSAREVFLERLVSGRECGDCIACCELLAINELELRKPADVLCPHNTGRGCGIYSTRPAVCRTWYCLWRRIDELPDYTRPDRIGVVFSVDRHDPPRTPFEKFYIVARAINGMDDFDNPRAKAAIDMFVEEGTLPVWISFGGQKRMIYPSPDLADAVINPITTVHRHLLPQAAEWRKKLKLD